MYAALSTLQDHVAPESFAAVLSTVQAELPAPAFARLATIDPVPLATGSIAQVHGDMLSRMRSYVNPNAQVHRATLVDGSEIVLKVRA